MTGLNLFGDDERRPLTKRMRSNSVASSLTHLATATENGAKIMANAIMSVNNAGASQAVEHYDNLEDHIDGLEARMNLTFETNFEEIHKKIDSTMGKFSEITDLLEKVIDR